MPAKEVPEERNLLCCSCECELHFSGTGRTIIIFGVMLPSVITTLPSPLFPSCENGRGAMWFI